MGVRIHPAPPLRVSSFVSCPFCFFKFTDICTRDCIPMCIHAFVPSTVIINVTTSAFNMHLVSVITGVWDGCRSAGVIAAAARVFSVFCFLIEMERCSESCTAAPQPVVPPSSSRRCGLTVLLGITSRRLLTFEAVKSKACSGVPDVIKPDLKQAELFLFVKTKLHWSHCALGLRLTLVLDTQQFPPFFTSVLSVSFTISGFDLRASFCYAPLILLSAFYSVNSICIHPSICVSISLSRSHSWCPISWFIYEQ